MTPPQRTACSPNRSVSVSSLKRGLDHAAARAADALGVGEREVAGVAGRVLVDRQQARHAGALGELAPHEVAGALRRDQRDVDAGAGVDLAEVDREAVGEQQQVAGRDPVVDLGLPDLRLLLVGQQDHHDVAAAGGVGDRQHLEAVGLAPSRPRAESLAQPDDDVDAGLLQVQRVRVALRAVAEDRDGLAVELREVCVVVVDHGREIIGRGCRSGARALRSPPRDLARRVRVRTTSSRALGSSARSSLPPALRGSAATRTIRLGTW